MESWCLCRSSATVCSHGSPGPAFPYWISAPDMRLLRHAGGGKGDHTARQPNFASSRGRTRRREGALQVPRNSASCHLILEPFAACWGGHSGLMRKHAKRDGESLKISKCKVTKSTRRIRESHRHPGTSVEQCPITLGVAIPGLCLNPGCLPARGLGSGASPWLQGLCPSRHRHPIHGPPALSVLSARSSSPLRLMSPSPGDRPRAHAP